MASSVVLMSASKAVLVPFEHRNSFLNQLESKGVLVNPHNCFAFVDDQHHDKDMVVQMTRQGLVSLLKHEDPVERMRGRSCSYAFRVAEMPEGDSEALLRDVIDAHISPVLSINGFVVKLTDLEEEEKRFENIFFELTKDEDTILIKDAKRPNKNPESIHINSSTRMTLTPDGRHFVCGRGNRLPPGKDPNPHTATLNGIAGSICAKPQLTLEMLAALKRIIEGADGDAPPEPKPKRRKQEVRVDLDKMDDDEFVQYVSKRYCTLQTAATKRLTNARMQHRLTTEGLEVPGWVKGLFRSIKQIMEEGEAEATAPASLGEVFELTEEDIADSPALGASGSWGSDMNIDKALEQALACDQGEGTVRRLHRLWTIPLRILGAI